MMIGIAGAGGIGSNVARHLVQSGITRLRVVDFDRVEPSNLDRQFYFMDQVGRTKVDCLKENLERLCPRVHVETMDMKIGPGQSPDIFKGCSLVVEGFDDPSAKKDLVEKMAGAGIPVVSASGIAGRDMAGIRTRKLGNCWIVGDFASDVAGLPLFPPKVALIAAMMAGIAMALKGDNNASEK